MELNTREVAVLVWCLAAVAWLTINAKKRGTTYGLMNVVRAFFCKPIMVVMVASFIWVFLSVVVLFQLGAWSFENIKTTVIWFFGFAFVALMNAPNEQGVSEPDYLKNYLSGLLGLSVIVVFLAESYTLPIYLELVLFPVIFIFSAFQVMAARRPEFKAVGGLSRWVIATIAFVFLFYSIANIVFSPEDFFSWKKLSDFFLPLILSFCFTPFVMFLRVFMTYEMMFKRISFWLKDRALLRYAKIRSVVTFGIDVDALSLWCDSLAHQKMNISTRKDIDESLRAAIKNKINEKVREQVAAEAGWNPFDAKDFLKQEGLVCRHYKAIYDGWGAESNFLKAGETQFSTISYYVTGNESAAKSLRLKLFLWRGDDNEKADKFFARLCILLVLQVIPEISEAHLVRFSTLKEMDQNFEYWHLNMHQEIFSEHVAADYERIFEISIL